MDCFKTNVDLPAIMYETNHLLYMQDDGKVDMAIAQGTGIPIYVKHMPFLTEAIKEIADLRHLVPLNLMINRLEASTRSPVHRDFLNPTPLQPNEKPTIERWHLVVSANDKCFWWDEETGMVQWEKGHWYGPMPYWRHHAVINNGDSPRLNIIVDLDCSEPKGEYSV